MQKKHYPTNLEWTKQYRLKNRQVILIKNREYSKKYRKNNHNAVAKREKKYKARPEIQEKTNKRSRDKRKNNPIWAFQQNLAAGLRHSLNNIGESKAGRSTFQLLNYTKQQYENYICSFVGHLCERCGKIIITLKNSQTDHIIPISLAKTEQDIILLFQLFNLRRICKKCNQEKGDKIELNFNQGEQDD